MYPSKKLSEIIVLNYWKAVDKSDKSDDGLYDVYGANGVMYKSKRFNFDGESIIVWRKWSAWAINRVSGKFWASDVTYYVTTEQNVDYVCYILKKLNLPELAKWVKPGINRNDVYGIEIPLPPLSTQSLIVARLDSAFASIDEQISHLRANIADVENMRKSVLEKSFQSGEYEMKNFWDIVDNFDGMRRPVKSSDRAETQWIFPYYWASWIIDYVNEYIFDWEYLLVSEDWANLVARKYPIAFLATDKFWVNNHAHIARWKRWISDNKYLSYYFASADISDYVSWAAQPKLNQKNLNQIQIPLPPLSRQHEIVAHLDRVFAETTALRGEYEAQILDLETLKQSLLEEAFVGRLVGEENEA